MTKLAAFDLEIAKEIPENEDWLTVAPLGISCAAIAADDFFMQIDGRLNPDGVLEHDGCIQLVDTLDNLGSHGYNIVTWNGAGFDMQVLMHECNGLDWIRELTLRHVDLMFNIVCLKGHYLGLDTACAGMNVQGKLHDVRLNNGQVITNMSGGLAPTLWKRGEFSAVSAYLAEDVRSLWELARAVEREKRLSWISKKGRFNSADMPELYTVRQALELPLPDTSWMTDPPTREKITGWMNLKTS